MLVDFAEQGQRCDLYSPSAMPLASGFLWNRQMMINLNCQGYAVAQFMQPEPAKYAHAPNLEARTFMQPEQPYYAHHPGRFFYVRDNDHPGIFSIPYAPVKTSLEHFCFSVGQQDIRWQLQQQGLDLTLQLAVPVEDVVELWSLRIRNPSDQTRRISLYPYFPVGYMSWMNQSGAYDADLGGIICRSVTPYQKVEDYFKNRDFKDQTFLLHETPPDAWETRQSIFEGEGGLNNPDGLQHPQLAGGSAHYQTPAAILQYDLALAPGEERVLRFLFGPAKDEQEAHRLRKRYLSEAGFTQAADDYREYLARGQGCLQLRVPDSQADRFFNHWLSRQVFYHGDVNRLSTDPQTRNYLQDNMGMVYVHPGVARRALLHALGQQKSSGAMPDGILLRPDAELKYINQIPHTDHCVWLPVCLQPYLDETDDYALLDELITSSEDKQANTVFERICRAMDWLLAARDERGLSYIAQGDWCDPMNMVGYKGRGVSAWLSLATAYALRLWADVCRQVGQWERANGYAAQAEAINSAVNQHLWDGNWFGRGITDDDVTFGISADTEGRIYLNPQSWALLSGAASPQQKQRMYQAIVEQLETPYGAAMLAPAYTGMREDVGRVTQKFPGSAENGSVYNHAAVFYIYSLYTQGEADQAWRLLRRMIPGPDTEDYLRRGQMPVFIPNYYRGAWYQYPEEAGRSSQLFNTGTVAWVYRCLVEGLFGLQGCRQGLRVAPNLPAEWDTAEVVRQFRGATVRVHYQRHAGLSEVQVVLDGEPLQQPLLTGLKPGREYRVEIHLPAAH